MTDEIEVYAPGQAPVLVGVVEPVAPPLARMGIGGPLDGIVVRSNSTRLDYRKPSITARYDMVTGERDVEVDVRPLTTYLPQIVWVVGVREYRIWAEEIMWSTLSTEAMEAEVVLRLIDAKPTDVWAVREL